MFIRFETKILQNFTKISYIKNVIAHNCSCVTWMNVVQFFSSDCSVTPENWRHRVWSQEAGRLGSSLRGCPQCPAPGVRGTRTRVKTREKTPGTLAVAIWCLYDTVFISLESVPSIREQIFWMLANVNYELVFACFMRQFDVFCTAYLSNKTTLWKWK